MVLRSVYFMVKFRIFIPELWDFIHQIVPVRDFKAIFRMSHCKLRTPWPIHFKLRIVIGIDSLMVCILFGEISIFHSRVMGLYSSNCRRLFFVCRTVNWEPLGQFTSNFAQLLELIVLRSVYFLVKFRFFIQELWERKSLQILYECWRRAYHALLSQLFIKRCQININKNRIHIFFLLILRPILL